MRPYRLTTRHLAAGTGTTPTPTTGGRWFRLGREEVEATVGTQVTCDQLLTRYGVVTRGSVAAEEVTGGFARIYKALTVFEDSGQVRRGYYVAGLGGAQFAGTSTVDELRRHGLDELSALNGRRTAPSAVVLAATDPANPFGAALEWPASRGESGGHRPGRKPGAVVVLVDGDLAVFVERGGKTVLTGTDDDAVLASAAAALVTTVRAGRLERLTIDQVDGATVLGSDFGRHLVEAGFATTPRGVRMRYGQHA